MCTRHIYGQVYLFGLVYHHFGMKNITFTDDDMFYWTYTMNECVGYVVHLVKFDLIIYAQIFQYP